MPRDGTETRARLLDAAQTLILESGFAGTSVESIIERAAVTKGAFFHHFPSKHDLALALVERYAALDAEHLDAAMGRAERLSRDPLQQLLIFAGLFEESFETYPEPAPGCLYASYCYEAQLFDERTHAVMRRAVLHWRERMRGKLAEVAERYPPRLEVDLNAVADMPWVIAEGAFVLARVMRESGVAVAHARQFRNYVELLFTPS